MNGNGNSPQTRGEDRATDLAERVHGCCRLNCRMPLAGLFLRAVSARAAASSDQADVSSAPGRYDSLTVTP
jgi:hypothetical protein